MAGPHAASLFRVQQLIRSPDFNRPTIRVSSSGDSPTSVHERSSQTLRASLQNCASELRKILRIPAISIASAPTRSKPSNIRHILALSASRGYWEFLIFLIGRPDGVREDFPPAPADNRPGQIERLPNPGRRRSLKPRRRPEGPPGYKLGNALGGIGKAYVPWRSAPLDTAQRMFLHEGGRRADSVGMPRPATSFDEYLLRNAGARPLCIGNGRIDKMPRRHPSHLPRQ